MHGWLIQVELHGSQCLEVTQQHKFVCMCACVYVCMCVCVHVCMCACVRACARMCVSTYLIYALIHVSKFLSGKYSLYAG